jgi:hypothetical protein
MRTTALLAIILIAIGIVVFGYQGIDEREKDDLVNSLMDSFIKRTLHYLSHPDFPNKYVLKEFQGYRKRKTWYQNDRRV